MSVLDCCHQAGESVAGLYAMTPPALPGTPPVTAFLLRLALTARLTELVLPWHVRKKEDLERTIIGQ